MAKKLRIAWFSDCDSEGEPAYTLSSYCTRLLVPRLREQFDIELFSDRLSLARTREGIRHYLTAYRLHEEQPFDLYFYQLEDHRRARFVRSHLGVMPGVLWAHDLFLSDLGAEAFHSSPWERTIRKYHNGGVPFADRNHPAQQFAPLAYREVSLSPVVLCSSQRGLGALPQITGPRITVNAQGEYLYGYLPVPVEGCEQQRRAAGEGVVHLITPASEGTAGRAHKFLQALSTLPFAWRLAWLIDPSERGSIDALLDEFAVRDRVTVVEGRSVEEWQRLIRDADIALHLHNGVFGHTGPFFALSLQAGLPCLGLRGIGGSDFPEGVVWTVAPGHHEAGQIRETIITIVNRGTVACGEIGQRFVHRESGIEGVTEELAQIFFRAAPSLRSVMNRWQALAHEARGALFQEVRGMMDGVEEGELSPFSTLFVPAARDLGW